MPELKEQKVEKVAKKRGRKPKYQSPTAKITGIINADAFALAISDIEKDLLVKASDVADILFKTMEQAYLEWSYPGLFKDKDNYDPAKDLIKAKVVVDDESGSFKIFDVKTVTPDDDIVDDAYQISLEDASEFYNDVHYGDVIDIPFDVTRLDKAYVRRVKQLFQAHLKEASKQTILSVYSDHIGNLIKGRVTRVDNNSYELNFGKASGILRRYNLIPQDRFAVGDDVLVYLIDVSDKSNPPSLSITRSNEKFIIKLFERAVPEISSGEVEIKKIARVAGKRTKIFVSSNDANVDPIGTCVGTESSRIRSVLSELHGEKIDVLRYYDNKALQIIEAMKPAQVIGIACPEDFFDSSVHYDELEEEENYEFPKITVVVTNGNQGVAIGSQGVNVRLASQITKSSISVLQADEAIKEGLKYMLIPDIEKLLGTKAPIETIQEEEIEEPIEEPIEEEETLADVERKKEEEKKISQPAADPNSKTSEMKEKELNIEHVEITNKPKISLEELEEAMKQKKGPSETKRSRHSEKKANKEEKVSQPLAGMPIYTEEELKEMQEQEEEDYNDYDNYDDNDYDQYDYYEDENDK